MDIYSNIKGTATSSGKNWYFYISYLHNQLILRERKTHKKKKKKKKQIELHKL